jgi:hypothetical protein
LRVWEVGSCVQALIRDPSTETARHFGADGYTLTEHLLFLVVDELRIANWLQSKDGQRNRNRPEPLSPLAPPRHRLGSVPEGVTQDQVLSLLASLAPQPEE